MKNGKSNFGFLYTMKYGKFWSISLELFIKHKPLFSEECRATDAGGRVEELLVKNDDALEVTIVVVIEPEKESGIQVIGSYLLVSDSRELLWRQFYQGDPSGINCRIHHQSYSTAHSARFH